VSNVFTPMDGTALGLDRISEQTTITSTTLLSYSALLTTANGH